MVFIRKLLDFCFTKRELSWLDDLIPESKKKKEDDKKKKEKEVNGWKVDSLQSLCGSHQRCRVVVGGSEDAGRHGG